jgi:hypothetical protein
MKSFNSGSISNVYELKFEKLSVNSDVELTHLAIKYGLIDLNPVSEHTKNVT